MLRERTLVLIGVMMLDSETTLLERAVSRVDSEVTLLLAAVALAPTAVDKEPTTVDIDVTLLLAAVTAAATPPTTVDKLVTPELTAAVTVDKESAALVVPESVVFRRVDSEAMPLVVLPADAVLMLATTVDKLTSPEVPAVFTVDSDVVVELKAVVSVETLVATVTTVCDKLRATEFVALTMVETLATAELAVAPVMAVDTAVERLERISSWAVPRVAKPVESEVTPDWVTVLADSSNMARDATLEICSACVPAVVDKEVMRECEITFATICVCETVIMLPSRFSTSKSPGRVPSTWGAVARSMVRMVM